MKRLISILTITAVIIGISVVGFGAPVSATQNVTVGWTSGPWITLFIPPGHRTVTLTQGGGVADEEAGTLHPRTHPGTFKVRVRTNVPAGFVLTVSATATTVPAGVTPGEVLSRFEIQGADLTTWTPLGAPVTLATRAAAGTFVATDIKYQFRVIVTDPPGTYSVTIIYTATTR